MNKLCTDCLILKRDKDFPKQGRARYTSCHTCCAKRVRANYGFMPGYNNNTLDNRAYQIARHITGELYKNYK